jgi:hypothetical protein
MGTHKDKEGSDYFTLSRNEDRDPHAIGRWIEKALRGKKKGKRVEL